MNGSLLPVNFYDIRNSVNESYDLNVKMIVANVTIEDPKIVNASTY